MLRSVSVLLFFLTFCNVAAAQGVATSVPDDIDVNLSYVFYLPDEVVTPDDPQPRHPEYGEYQYAEIVNRISAARFTVITQPRETTAHPYLVAADIAKQIRQLADAGVPASHIGIVGAGQGAVIAITAVSKLGDSDLQVVLLSACSAPFIDYWEKENELLSGNVLSFYVAGSTRRGPCLPFLEYCGAGRVKQHREIALPESVGEGYFYKGTADWMLPAIAWLRGDFNAVSDHGLVPPEVSKPR
ncbi:MAG: hypothetical protein IH600_15435 [Bacteroidetes bacterium]|nr:hypothetical protein [Bacteroidota bacterium]